MKLTVLVDSNTYIDRYFHGEPALCFHLDCDRHKILFDAGYSDIFLNNAVKAGIDLSVLSHIVISHGHNDHSQGLKYYFSKFPDTRIKIVAHPNCFLPKTFLKQAIGSPLSNTEIQAKAELKSCREPFNLTDNLIFLGEIPRRNSFEALKPIGRSLLPLGWQDDYLLDDSALAYKTDQGLYIITGCSHSGICNIIEHAKVICGDARIRALIGGFHLFDLNDQFYKTQSYFLENKIEALYPCHCVSLAVKAKLCRKFNVREVGVGL